MSEQQQHTVNEACKVRFEVLDSAIQEIKSNNIKSSDWIQDMRDVIVRLTIIQEQQQKSLENQQQSLEDQQKALQDQADAQNLMIKEMMELEKARQSREEALIRDNANKKELSTKKVVGITTVVSTLITVIGSTLVAIFGK